MLLGSNLGPLEDVCFLKTIVLLYQIYTVYKIDMINGNNKEMKLKI